jgi:hypothetical protein
LAVAVTAALLAPVFTVMQVALAVVVVALLSI